MPPLNLEIDLASRNQTENDDCSVSSEISLDFVAKEYENDRNGASSSSGWNPDDSDYSLNVLLPSKDQAELDDSAKTSLMGSDYSLNVALTKSQEASAAAVAAEPTRCPPKRTKSGESLEPMKRKTSTTKVTFYSRVRIQRVTNRKDLSQEQVEAVWYSRAEFREIRQECFDTISILTEGDEIIDDDDNVLCIRGLEYKTKGAYKERQRNKIEIRKLVFEEQEFQYDNSMNDADYIADIARECSRTCVKAAIEAARQDEIDARAYLMS